jgi:excisionase family DNA binding protein
LNRNDHSATGSDALKRRFLTPSEAADFLGGLNSRTVTRWAREGYLPSYPIGEGKRRLWRFLAGDLTQWMHSRRTGQLPFDVLHGTLNAAADAPTGG